MKLKLNAVNIKNRRATFDFDIVETYTAGIVLTGTEIKSIRLGKAGLTDAFCYENNGEIWIKNMYVGEYFYILQQSFFSERPQVAVEQEGDSRNRQGFERQRIFYCAAEGVYKRQGAGKGCHCSCQR